MQDLDDLFEAACAPIEPRGTIKFTLVGVHVPPSNPHAVELELAHAGDSNERYMKALKNAIAKGDTSEETSIGIFAKTVCRGWGHVLDLTGNPVQFTSNAVEKLLLKLHEKNRGDIVVRAMNRAADAHRFTAGNEDLGKE